MDTGSPEDVQPTGMLPLQVGVVGVGMMGAPIAERLADVGYRVTVCDGDEAALAGLVDRGLETVTAPWQCVECDVVLIIVNTLEQVEQSVFGADGVLSGQEGSAPAVVVLSTVPRGAMESLAQRARERSARFVDAPVSGGPDRARRGDLTVMAGAAPDDLDATMPVLQAIGSRVFPCGPPGTGTTAKALNNVLSTYNSIVSAEVFRLALESGLGLEQVASIFEVSTGRNFLTANPEAIRAYFERFAGSRAAWDGVLALLVKDSAAADELAEPFGDWFPLIRTLPRLLDSYAEAAFASWSTLAAGKRADG